MSIFAMSIVAWSHYVRDNCGVYCAGSIVAKSIVADPMVAESIVAVFIVAGSIVAESKVVSFNFAMPIVAESIMRDPLLLGLLLQILLFRRPLLHSPL